jgi:hypothetical protein
MLRGMMLHRCREEAMEKKIEDGRVERENKTLFFFFFKSKHFLCADEI